MTRAPPSPWIDAIETRSWSGSVEIFERGKLRSVTDAEFAEAVAAAKRGFADAGLRAGDCVGLLAANSLGWIVCDLALQAIGAVPVCFPPDGFRETDPIELAERFALSLLVTDAPAIGDEDDWIIRLDRDDFPARAKVRDATGRLREIARETDLATVIFSSGSSGRFKALLLSRRGIEGVITAFVEGWSIGPGDRLFVGLPMSVFQQRVLVYAALQSGAEFGLTDPSLLFFAIRALAPTIVLAPPGVFEAIENRRVEPAEAARQLGGKARLLLTGSAPSKASTLGFFDAAGLPIYQLYGMAEIGFIAWNRPGDNAPMTVGRPLIEGSVSIAADGEIIVDHPCAQAIGYFGEAAAVEAATFLADGGIATGDLGQFDADDRLTIIGRKKNLIVTAAGEKFSVDEIERAMLAVDGVDHAVIIASERLPWLGAVVAIRPGTTNGGSAIIERAIAELARDHNAGAKPQVRIGRIVPTERVFTAENGLLTRNLKVDRAAVARAFADQLEPADHAV